MGPHGRSGRLCKISPPTGIRSPDRPARSESRYRLSYPGPRSSWRNLIILGDRGDRSVLKVRNNSASDTRQIPINTAVRISYIARQNLSPGRGRTELSFAIKVCLTVQADVASEHTISLQSIKLIKKKSFVF